MEDIIPSLILLELLELIKSITGVVTHFRFFVAAGGQLLD